MTTEQPPGAANEPEGPTNTGTGVHHRVAPGVGAPATNQGTDEAVAPTADRAAVHPAADEGSTADTSRVGTGDAQAPRAADPPDAEASAGPTEQSSWGRATDSVPGSGKAYRTPGHQGDSANPLDTDVAASAARIRAAVSSGPVPAPGDIAGVSAGAVDPLEGSSTESDVAEGARTPLSATERAQGTPGKPAIAPRPSAPDGEVGTR